MAGILFCGLNGAGKSTLAKAFAEKMHYRLIDIEDLYFPKADSAYPYSRARAKSEAEALLLYLLQQEDDFVLASVKGDFAPEIVSYFTLAVLVDTPKEIRMKRIYERSFNKFGNRICEGGDLYEQEKAFFDFAASRDENMVKSWLSSLSCPIITLDGTLPIDDNVKRLSEAIHHA